MRELEELKVRVDPCRIRCRIWMLCWENRRDIELNSEKSIRDIQALQWCWWLDVGDGYVDVGDECWRPNVLVTTLRCWWFCHQHLKSVSIIKSPTSLSPSVTIRNFVVKLTIEKRMSKAVSSIRSFSRIINEHRLQQIEEIDMIRRCYPNTIFLEIRLEFEIIKTDFTLDG